MHNSVNILLIQNWAKPSGKEHDEIFRGHIAEYTLSFRFIRIRIYSIAETTKVNNLRPYEYFEYLLTEIPKHMEYTDRSFCEDLLPWSPNLPEYCGKPEKNSNK